MTKRFIPVISKEELYLHYIQNMCALLEMQAPDCELDDWARDMIAFGLYEPYCLTHTNGGK